MTLQRPIYLDYNATTPIDPAVLHAMLPYLREHFGNPSSTHAYGKMAHDAIALARHQVASLLNARPEEILFTSGGSEASNHAIKGVIFPRLFGSAGGPHRASIHVVASQIEHPATLKPLAFLQRLGVEVTLLPVDRYGMVEVDALREALQKPTALVSIMHSNNEVGTLQPIEKIARVAHEHGALMHVDAAQSVGKVPVDVQALDVDFLSVAGHKLYAPKGIGALYLRDGKYLEPLVHGAGQESGRRAGTENVPYAVGLGMACEVARNSLPQATDRLRTLRDRLWSALQQAWGERIALNGHPTKRLPNTLNVNFLGHVGAELLASVPEIAASTGSACHEGQVHLSPVLKAMGVAENIGRGAVRLSVGRYTTDDEVDQAASLLNAKK